MSNDPNDPASPAAIAKRHLNYARTLLEIGRFTAAEKEARAALAVDIRNLDGHLYLSRALLGQARYKEAEQEAASAVSVAPDDGYTHYLLGFVRHASGNSDGAVECLRQAVRLSPRAPRFYSRLAIALLDMKDREGARAAIENALSLDTENHLLLDEAARVFGVMGEYARAESLARAALEREPSNAAAHWRLAWLLGLRRMFAESEVAAKEAVRLDPNNAGAWEELGLSLYEQGKLPEAQRALEETVRLRPSAVTASRLLLALRAKNKSTAQIVDEAAAQVRDQFLRDRVLQRRRLVDWLVILSLGVLLLRTLLRTTDTTSRIIVVVSFGLVMLILWRQNVNSRGDE